MVLEDNRAEVHPIHNEKRYVNLFKFLHKPCYWEMWLPPHRESVAETTDKKEKARRQVANARNHYRMITKYIVNVMQDYSQHRNAAQGRRRFPIKNNIPNVLSRSSDWDANE